jgi:hypothetical protein
MKTLPLSSENIKQSERLVRINSLVLFY